MNTLTRISDTIVLDAQPQDEARQLVEQAGDHPLSGFRVVIDGANHEVPALLNQLLRLVVEQASQGGAMTVRTLPDELTTTVAAEMIGVSRPTFMKMLADGVIPSHRVGSHARVKADDVIQLKASRLASQRSAFDALRKMDA